MSSGIPTSLSFPHKKSIKRHKKLPIQLFPTNAQRRYVTELNDLVATMIDLTKKYIYPQIDEILTQAKLLRPTTDMKTDDFSDQIDEGLELTKQDLSEQFPDSRLRQMALSIGYLISRHNRKEVLKVVSSVVGVQVNKLFLS